MVPISIKAEEIFRIGSFTVTNSLLVSLLVVLLLVFTALLLRRKIVLIPGKFQNIAEILMEKLLGLMESILGDREKSEKYFPLVATIFLFVLMANWMGLIPGVGSVGFKEAHGFIPFLRAPSSDINFTLALAILSVLLTNIYAIQVLGFFKHLGKFINFKNPIQFFVGILEGISEISRIISFAFRLFGNVFAGEVLLLIIAFLLPVVGPIPFVFLEVFVGFIQAFVFSMLTLVFLGLHTTSHQESH